MALLTVVAAILLIATLALLVLVGYILWIRKNFSHIPSPPLLSFFGGHSGYFDKSRVKTKHGTEARPEHVVALELHELIGRPPVFVTFLFITPFVFCMDPLSAKDLLTNPKYSRSYQIYKFFMNLMGERFLGNGIFTILDKDEWRPRRKQYDPAFNKGYLKSLVPAMNECTVQMIDKLRTLADGVTTVPMKYELSNLTSSIISQVGFSSDFSEWTAEKLNLQYAERSDVSLYYLVEMSFKALEKQFELLVAPYHCLHPFASRKYREVIRALRRIGKDCIKKRIAAIERGETVPNDILTCILKSEEDSVDIEVLVDDFVTFFIGGQETTADALAFSVIEILRHPHVLSKLLSELDEVIGSSNITADHIEQLHYTEQIVQETLRLHPPVGALFKLSPKEGFTLSGYRIPADAFVIMATNCYNRMPEFFEDPEVFDPDRFSPGKERPSSFVYFPFAVGLRSCLGKHLAMMEVKLVLAQLFRTFTLALPHDYEVIEVLRTSTQPHDNVPCTLTLRKE